MADEIIKLGEGTVTIKRYTGIMIHPQVKREDGSSPTAIEKYIHLVRAMKSLPQVCSISLATLTQAVQDGAEVAIIEIAVNDEHILKLLVTP